MRTVLLTGATGKLGSHIAQKFVDNGDLVVGLNRQACDLSSEYKIESFLSDFKKKYDGVDILINNAAVQGPVGPVQDNNWNEWQHCIKVNLFAPVILIRAFLPGMIHRNYGRIINIAGGGATSSRPNYSAYATAKTGLVRFTETLADELYGYNITANCVSPGAMVSRLTQGQGVKEEHNEEKASALVFALTTEPYAKVNGELISAIWDDWQEMDCKGRLRRIK